MFQVQKPTIHFGPVATCRAVLLKTLMEVQCNQQSTQHFRLERLAHYFDVSVALRQDENWRMFLTPQAPGTHIKVLLSAFICTRGR